MTYYPFPRNSITKTLFGIFLLALLFVSRDTLVTGALVGVHMSFYLSAGLMLAAGLAFLAVNRHQWKQIFQDKRMWVLLISTAILLLPMAVKGDWQLMYFSVLLCVWFGVFLTYFVTSREVARYFVLFITALGLYSVLAAYLLRIPVDRGLFSVPMFQNAIGHKFHNFFFSFVPDTYVKNRNFGIFREPGVYQFFLLIAMILNNYSLEWKKPLHLWLINGILAVTMLSTFATGGVVEMGLLAIVIFFDKKMYRDKRIVALAAALVTVAVIVLVISALRGGALYKEIYYMLISKFKKSNASSSDRFMSIVVDGILFLKNPLMGAKMADVLFAMQNNTTSTMIFFASYGILGGAFHVLTWLCFLWNRERKLWTNLALVVIAFMSFNTQNLITDTFFWLFPMMALTERAVPWLEEKRKK